VNHEWNRDVHRRGSRDEEVSALYLDAVRMLVTLQTLEKTGGWKRPSRSALQAIRRLYEDLLRRIAIVQTKTLGWEEVWER